MNWEAGSNTNEISFSTPIRMHHLNGGAALMLGDNDIGMVISPGGLRPFRFPKSQPVQSLLRQYRRMRVIGRTIFAHADEMKDPVTDHFVLAACTAKNKCLATDQAHYWHGVSVACCDQSKAAESVCASRIASQIRTCVRRLERLSMAYRTALSSIDTASTREPSTITNDKYAQHIGTEFRSMLNELYGLRDAVNAAVYRFKYGKVDGFQTSRLRALVTGDPNPTARLIDCSMFDDCGDLLLDRMSLYRGVALHSLGMNHAIFGDGYQRLRVEGEIGAIIFLAYPLYDDIAHMREIERAASKGVLRPATREEAQRFLAKDDHLDGLEFCFDCLVRLLRIAECLASETPLPSYTRRLTDDDIVQATFTDASGKVRRVKRDATTGKLVDY